MDLPDLAVVISGAGAGRSVTIEPDDPDFTRLERFTTHFDTVTERVPQAWQEGRYPPVVGTVVWGLTGVGGWPQTHRAPGTDTAIERQDQIFLADDGTPWIRTDPAVDTVDDDFRWHHASRADFDRLAGSGLFAPGPRPRSDHKVRWALIGAGAGFALALAPTWLRRFRHPLREPHQQLVDV